MAEAVRPLGGGGDDGTSGVQLTTKKPKTSEIVAAGRLVTLSAIRATDVPDVDLRGARQPASTHQGLQVLAPLLPRLPCWRIHRVDRIEAFARRRRKERFRPVSDLQPARHQGQAAPPPHKPYTTLPAVLPLILTLQSGLTHRTQRTLACRAGNKVDTSKTEHLDNQRHPKWPDTTIRLFEEDNECRHQGAPTLAALALLWPCARRRSLAVPSSLCVRQLPAGRRQSERRQDAAPSAADHAHGLEQALGTYAHRRHRGASPLAPPL